MAPVLSWIRCIGGLPSETACGFLLRDPGLFSLAFVRGPVGADERFDGVYEDRHADGAGRGPRSTSDVTRDPLAQHAQPPPPLALPILLRALFQFWAAVFFDSD